MTIKHLKLSPVSSMNIVIGVLSVLSLTFFNNSQCMVENSHRRIVRGLDNNQNNTAPINSDDIPSEAILKRNTISLASKSDDSNLGFFGSSNSLRSPTISDIEDTREVKTNTHIWSGNVLVLGGISKKLVSENVSGVPLVLSIPSFIGNFFKRRVKGDLEPNLMIFISASKIEPRVRGVLNTISKHADDQNVRKMNQSLSINEEFESLCDTLVPTFFNPEIRQDIEKIKDYKQGNLFTPRIYNQKEVRQ